MSEEVNVKARYSLLVYHQFVCNDIFLCMYRKTQTRFVVSLSFDMALWTLFKNGYFLSSYPIIIVFNNYLHNPRSTQCLHRKAWGGTWGCGQK